ncbi:MAG: aldehyde ferredoxin oxidoreductase family protein [Chloroflexi bacterium]|nr:aldehyde ferredoxin oxidoreductase family protein [Chloroflexota bacterium]
MDLCGFGKILNVDLATGRIEKQDVDPQLARKYLGGMGLSCRMLYDEVGPDVEPFSPDNIVIFANGPLTGTSAPCAGRTEITTRSPLTGIVGSGNTGGSWGALLKRAGVDQIVVRKCAERPVYLWVNDDSVEIRDASHLWGKDTAVTSDILQAELGSPAAQIAVMAIGQAGEHLVTYACPINEYHHTAARAGAGAVMGAKKLKAIAVRGTGAIKMARPKEFREAARAARDRVKEAHVALMGAASILPDPMDVYLARGCMPARNFQTGVMPRLRETAHREVYRKHVTGPNGTCYACPVTCFLLAEVNEGKYAGVKVNRAPAPGIIMDAGAKCGLDNLHAIWNFKETCHHLGLDYVSASGCISFAMELFQYGIITTQDTDGIELSWGNEDAMVQMLHKIAFREGFGDVLAEGSVRAAETLGRGASRYAMTVKGMEMMFMEPRTGPTGFVFGDLTNPRGGDNLKTTHGRTRGYAANWWVDKFDMPEDVKARIYSMPPEQFADTWEGKPMHSRWLEDMYSIANALGLCFFTCGPLLALGPTYFSGLFSAFSGLDMTPEEITKCGERIFTLLKAYDVRLGLTRKDDIWPDRFFEEPLPEGPTKGAVLSRAAIGQLLDEYYDLRGWDRATGIPSAEKLIEVGLEDIADELTRLGKLPKHTN